MCLKLTWFSCKRILRSLSCEGLSFYTVPSVLGQSPSISSSAYFRIRTNLYPSLACWASTYSMCAGTNFRDSEHFTASSTGSFTSLLQLWWWHWNNPLLKSCRPLLLKEERREKFFQRETWSEKSCRASIRPTLSYRVCFLTARCFSYDSSCSGTEWFKSVPSSGKFEACAKIMDFTFLLALTWHTSDISGRNTCLSKR